MLGEDVAPERPAAGPLAAARPRLAVRRRARQPRVGEVLRGRRPAPQDRYDDPRPRASKAKPRHDLPRVGKGGLGRGQAEGADPRPAQRREPDRRADPPRDDQLPQQGGRQGLRPTLPPAQRFTRGPQAGDAALPVDAAPRLPAADLRSPRSSTTCSANGRKLVEPDAAPTDVPDDADRVLGRGVPARAQHDPQRLQLELPLPRHRRHAGLDVHLLRARRRPRPASGGC